MKERPILFNGAMVGAILDGSKTQTRRIVKPQPVNGWDFEAPPVLGRITSPHPKKGRFGAFVRRGLQTDFPEYDLIPCPYGQHGDRLWVKETWRPWTALDPWDLNITYAADGEDRIIRDGEFGERDWTMPKAAARGNVSPLFMPRWASRITLEITGVRVERLNDCSDADALAEGVDRTNTSIAGYAKERYQQLWESINGSGSWNANPWVWVVEFRRDDT